MAVIKPFKAIRPSHDKVHLVSTKSIDNYSANDLDFVMTHNPFSFLHIIKPEYGKVKKGKSNTTEMLAKTKWRYLQYMQEHIFIRDEEESFYVYQQIKGHDSFVGIIACASIDDYFNGVIKVHEQTIAEREEKLKDYLEVCDFNAEPVCVSYKDDEVVNGIIEKTMHTPFTYDFTDMDKVRHRVWRIFKKEDVATVVDRFSKIPALYIADGHHRSASSALLGKSKREKTPKYKGNEAFNYYMVVFFPETQLKIYDFNRVVKDLNGMSDEEFLLQLSEKFLVECKENVIYHPAHLHNISMYLGQQWYSLTAKPGTYNDKDPVQILDAVVLTEHILTPLLNIDDLRTNKRISFVSGIKGMEELQRLVDSGKMKVAFGLYPATMDQIKAIADTGNSMPPKTTWVEPKLQNGLVIYSLS